MRTKPIIKFNNKEAGYYEMRQLRDLLRGAMEAEREYDVDYVMGVALAAEKMGYDHRFVQMLKESAWARVHGMYDEEGSTHG